MIKKTCVNDGWGGRSKKKVSRLVALKVIDSEGNFISTGTTTQIFSQGGFMIKIMVRDGENRHGVVKQLDGGVLGLF